MGGFQAITDLAKCFGNSKCKKSVKAHAARYLWNENTDFYEHITTKAGVWGKKEGFIAMRDLYIDNGGNKTINIAGGTRGNIMGYNAAALPAKAKIDANTVGKEVMKALKEITRACNNDQMARFALACNEAGEYPTSW